MDNFIIIEKHVHTYNYTTYNIYKYITLRGYSTSLGENLYKSNIKVVNRRNVTSMLKFRSYLLESLQMSPV